MNWEFNRFSSALSFYIEPIQIKSVLGAFRVSLFKISHLLIEVSAWLVSAGRRRANVESKSNLSLRTHFFFMRWNQFITHANYQIINSNLMDWAKVAKIHTPPSAKQIFLLDERALYKDNLATGNGDLLTLFRSNVTSCDFANWRTSIKTNHICVRTRIWRSSWSFRVMVNFWMVLGYSNRSNREKDKGYYRIPPILSRSKPKKQALRVERRATRLARSRRGDFAADTTEFYRVCGDHFISGI